MPTGTNDNAGVRVIPPLLYIGFFIFGYVIHYFRPIHLVSAESDALLKIMGGILLAFGLLVNFAGVFSFRKHHTSLIPIKPSTALVTDGVYSLTRNPMYVGHAIAYFGGVLMANSLWPLLLFPLVLLVTQKAVIEKEEAYMERKFGEEYRAYKSRVRQWI